MRLLDVPIGLLINFHELILKNGISRMILPGANQTEGRDDAEISLKSKHQQKQTKITKRFPNQVLPFVSFVAFCKNFRPLSTDSHRLRRSRSPKKQGARELSHEFLITF
jgi:hypothetical protein